MIADKKRAEGQDNSILKPVDPLLQNFSSKCHVHGEDIEYLCETCNELTCE